MANIQVTQNQRSQVIAANRDLLVTVNLTGSNFSVYAYIPQRGVDIKAARGQLPVTFLLLKDETIECHSMGTGTITIDTVNA
jgi:hypothetical protein